MKLYLAKFGAFYLGCLACYLLQTEAHFGAVLSSALLGFLVTFIPFPVAIDRRGLLIAFFAGTFAGMSSPEIIHHSGHVFLISLLGAGIYLLLKPYFNGFGGKMGAIAWISTVLFILMQVFS